MIRYSNRFKAGTRRNKKWAKANGPDQHVPVMSDHRQTAANLLANITDDITPVLIRKATGCTPDINFGLKPNHVARTINVDWKAINDAKKAEQLIKEATIELENAKRALEDEQADTTTVEGAKEYMEKVLQREATDTIEPGHI